MTIAVCSQGSEVDSTVDQRFGRCAYFVLIDPNSEQFESIINPALDAGGGAGVQAAQLLGNKGVEVVLVGNIGPKAISVFNAANINVYTEIQDTVEKTMALYQEGKLKLLSELTVSSHFGFRQGGGSRWR